MFPRPSESPLHFFCHFFRHFAGKKSRIKWSGDSGPLLEHCSENMTSLVALACAAASRRASFERRG